MGELNLEDLIRTYVASLLSKPLVILSGSSGTGKTRLAIRFAEYLEDDKKESTTVTIQVNDHRKIISHNEQEISDMCANGNKFNGKVDGQNYPITLVMCSYVESEDTNLMNTISSHIVTTIELVVNNEVSQSNNRCVHVPVGADWTDGRYLLGYPNPFGTGGKTVYELTPTIRLLLRALHHNNRDLPYFLILDEMNLSHVERYFSAFLSIMEANRSSSRAGGLPLIDSKFLPIIESTLRNESEQMPEELESITSLIKNNKPLYLPPNVHIIGTVNIDETTYMFSPKVLDRAHVIELNTQPPSIYFDRTTQLDNFPTKQDVLSWFKKAIERRNSESSAQSPLEFITSIHPSSNELLDKTKSVLESVYNILNQAAFGFGYRVVQEVLEYLACSYIIAPSESWEKALDYAVLQKVLPKLHGNRRQLSNCLQSLQVIFSDNDSGFNLKQCYTKVERMQVTLQNVGYTSFIS